MAIDGMAPLLVFHIFNAGYHAKSLSKWLKFAVDDERQNTTAKGIGLTIPLYLSERLTKVAWQSHNMSISIGDITNGDKSYQRKIDNSVDIDLVFNRESLFLQLMMPLFSLCWQRLETNDYRISYYNRDIIIYKGRLTSLQQS
ncbi:MAG: hypothetical protein LBC07_00115, partial [Elusimicrobiota bacterium]|nr:hypothetical protein [Elusimicrobiota bacterium]